MPYRTFDDRIDGLVITFVNISDLKQIEEGLNETNQLFRLLLNSTSDIIIKLSTDLNILEFNSAAEEFFGMKHDKVINQSYIELFVPKPLRRKTEQQLNKLLTKADAHKIEMKLVGANTLEMKTEWTANVVFNSLNLAVGIVITTKK